MKSLAKLIIITVLAVSVSGCGWLDRKLAAITGDASEVCVSGVLYLQFTSGVSVKYNQDGLVATCKQ